MSTFQDNLDEFYLNYDTATLLKEDSEKEEIVSMFKHELGYPESLTSALLKFNKTYLNSVIMRIKVRQNKIEKNELKSDILKFNTDLEPILDKLLSEKFIKQYEKINEIKKNDSKVEVKKEVSKKKVKKVEDVEVKVVEAVEAVKEADVENVDDVEDVEEVEEVEEVQDVEENNGDEDDEDDEEDEDEEDEDDEDVEEGDEDGDDGDDNVEELTEDEVLEKFIKKCVKKNDGKMLALVDMYDAYEKFCETNDYDISQPSPFKKYMKANLGKPDGKGDKSIYKGYSIV